MGGSWDDQGGWGESSRSWSDAPNVSAPGQTSAQPAWSSDGGQGARIIAEPAGPPTLALGAAAVCVVVAAIASLLSPGRPLFSILAWLLAGFVCVGLLTLHAVADGRRRASPWYVQQPWTSPAALVVAVLAVAVVVYSSLTFALHVGRM